MKIVVATKSGTVIDEHFGRASSLTIFNVDEKTGKILTKEQIAGLGSCACDEHGDEKITALLDALSGCQYVLAARIGPHMSQELAERGITAFELFDEIQPSIEKIIRYEKKQNLGASPQTPLGTSSPDPVLQRASRVAERDS